MPELPEVETIRRTLAPRVAGRVIEAVEVRTPKFIVGASPEEFERAVAGRRITDLDRRGKFLIIHLDGGPTGQTRDAPHDEGPGDILIHLKMAGQLVWCEPKASLGATRDRHTHVVFRLDDGHELRFADVRHFGRIYFAGGDRKNPILRRALKTLAGLGPEPRPGRLKWSAFRDALASRRARIKPLLLDQGFVAGLGNIYADECLFRAGIHPLRRGSSLSEPEARALFEAMKEVIAEAIEFKGTSVRDYVDGEGRRGRFAERLSVYGRTGEPCPRCGAEIHRLVIAGRSAHFCPTCQPAHGPERPRTNV